MTQAPLSGSNEITYGDARRSWNTDFVAYMQTIVDDPAYVGMPCARDDEGKIDWTIPSNRSRGSKNWDGNQQRREWWRRRAESLGIPVEGAWISKVARTIHPLGRKPCQTCGRWMSIAYVYPNRHTVARFNRLLDPELQLEYLEFLTIFEVVDLLESELGRSKAEEIICSVFPGDCAGHGTQALKDMIQREYVSRESRKLSPGVYSNAPDRLDGFHSYNICCRSSQDRGRARDNLLTYSVDRRAYQQWSEGDWAVADMVMAQAGSGLCNDCQETGPLTADHVGPISLGFAHSPHFVPLCRKCNSAKNNRMSFADVHRLLAYEQAGEVVASWQTADLWNALKRRVSSDADALLLSKLLRVLQHHYLELLAEVLDRGRPDLLLQFLQPSHALKRIRLIGFDPSTLEFDSIETTDRQDGYAKSRASRMARIAFETLRHYGRRPHRNIQRVDDQSVSPQRAEFARLLDRIAEGTNEQREHLEYCLNLDAAARVKDGCFSSVLENTLAPPGATELRQCLHQVLQAYTAVLVERFSRGEAVSWDDFVED